jgi:outer membrane biosynthesis protein TonB
MFEIKIMLDASDRLVDALHHIANALYDMRPAEKPADNPVEVQAPEIDAQMPSECVETPEQPETPANEEEPKKRKPRSKKQASEPGQPKAEPEQPKDDTVLEPEPEPEQPKAEPEPEQPKAEPEPEQPKAEPEQPQDDDPLAGKGQSGEVLNELTKKAVQVLDALGIDRAVANRRIREYCAGNDIKFPTFPALLQAVGYAAAIAVCRGEI